MSRRTFWAAALLMLFVPGAARAQVLHRVGPGDTTRSLAVRYYEDARFAELIAAHNGLRGDPRTGSEIRVPSASRHEVRPGESWSDLAARYWSDARLGEFLAQWCGSGPDSPPEPESALVIPALVSYRLRAGETLVALSRRFFGGPERAEALASLNRIPNLNRVRAGQMLRIPLLQVARGPSGSPDATLSGSTRPGPARHDVAAAPPSGRDALPSESLMRAVNAYLDGSFEAALSQLEALKPEVLQRGTQAEKVLLLRHLAFSYVAFDRVDAACDAVKTLRKLEKKPELDPEMISPKIRAAFEGCD